MEWLNNLWVISAGAAALCGIVVTLVVRHLFSGREHREYQLKVTAANNEIIQAIRPAVLEKIIPSGAMLDSLFAATARKYGVNSGDLLPKVGFANELIKEVVDNRLLSSQQKVEFCELLAGMKQADGDAFSKRVVEIVTFNRKADAFDPSGLLGLTTALTAFVTTAFFHLRGREDFLLNGDLMKLLPMLAILSIIPIVAFLVVDLARQVANRPRSETDHDNALDAPPAAPAPGHRELTLLESKPVSAS